MTSYMTSYKDLANELAGAGRESPLQRVARKEHQRGTADCHKARRRGGSAGADRAVATVAGAGATDPQGTPARAGAAFRDGNPRSSSLALACPAQAEVTAGCTCSTPTSSQNYGARGRMAVSSLGSPGSVQRRFSS